MTRILIPFLSILLAVVGICPTTAQDINRLREMEENTGNNALNDYDYNSLEDSTETEIDVNSIPIELHMWNVDSRLGNRKEAPVDTLYHHFQNSNFTDGVNGEYNYLGNMGSPRQSRIFLNRPEKRQNIFLEPFTLFLRSPEEVMFTNTKSPFTNLTYHKAGGKRNGEDRFKAYFSTNVNKRIGFGFSFDYLYGRGQYNSQSTSFFNGSLFGSYIGDRYQVHTIMSFDKLKMAENGGIADDRYITNPLDMMGGKKHYQPSDIPTNLSATWNRNKGFYIFLTHRYNLGFEQFKKDEESNKQTQEFIPVTSFIHTLQVDKYEHEFIAYENPNGYHAQNFFRRDSAEDITKSLAVKNTLAIAIREGFSKWAKAGLTGFITHEYRRFTLPDTLHTYHNPFEQKYKEQNLLVGGEFAKRQGKLIHYNITGEVVVAGTDIGQFNVDGKFDLNFRLFNDTVRFDAHAFIKSLQPTFYYRHYHSSHAWWDHNNLSKEYRTRVEGSLSIDHWRTKLSAGFENIKNYTYFSNDAVAYTKEDQIRYSNNPVVHQSSDNIQVFSATLKQDFKVGIFHLDNEVTYQKSSNETVLPLPQINLYHNLYISAKLAKKVLSLELGADMRYFTSYYAPDYSPVISQYYVQDPNNRMKIGGYPLINVYLNLHLKRTRIYVMMYHVNKGMGNSNYFLAPHYPQNPRMFKFGISWNFFD